MATNTLPADVRPAKIERASSSKSEPTALAIETARVGDPMSNVTAALATTFITSIERHWQDRLTAYREFEADPAVPDDNDRANEYWDRIDAAETGILNSPDTSARAAELRLWVAWSHANSSRAAGHADDLVVTGDVPALLRIRSDLDWHEKLIFAAILNLRGEG